MMVRRRSKGPDPVDVHVGGRMRQRRVLVGLSQHDLGDRIGISYQQVQKYEKGANCISASRLYELARILDVPVGFFFEDLPAFSGTAPIRDMGHGLLPGCRCADCRDRMEPGFDPDRRTLKLVGAYYRIRPPGLRKKLLALIQCLGSKDTGKPTAAPRP